jgi:hypothetical protein
MRRRAADVLELGEVVVVVLLLGQEPDDGARGLMCHVGECDEIHVATVLQIHLLSSNFGRGHCLEVLH